ncbi:unnamed protein product [Musa acuminata subsp. burmannicoides]
MESIMDMPQLTPEEDEKASMFALQLVMGSILPITVNAAMELELLEIIVKAGPGKLSPTDVVSRMPTENPEAVAMVDRILRLLAAYEVVSCSVETGHDGHPSCKYGAAPVCKYFTKNEDGVSLAALSLANHEKINMESCYSLKEAVLEGGVPFEKAHRMTLFERQRADPRYNKLLAEGMRGHSTIFTKKLVEIYRGFDDVKVLVDVGGGTGATIHKITSSIRTSRASTSTSLMSFPTHHPTQVSSMSVETCLKEFRVEETPSSSSGSFMTGLTSNA